MPKVTFLFTHATLDRVWKQALELLPRGVEVTLSHQGAPFDPAMLSGCAAAYLDISRHAACFDAVVTVAATLPLAVPGGLDMQAAFPQGDTTARAMVQAYIKAGTPRDLAHAALFLLHRAGAWENAPPSPGEPVLAGIHHASPATGPVVAILFDRGAWLNGDTVVVDHCVAALSEAGLGPAALFCDAELGRRLGEPDHPLTRLLDEHGSRLAAIWNLTGMHGRTEAGDGGPFVRHGVPVFQLLRHWTADEAQWRGRTEGLSPMSVAFAVTRPEMMGSIDPTLVACTTTAEDGTRQAQPVADQVARLVGRTKAWAALRTKASGDKRVAILLHNPPCKALEATIGNAAALDGLDSTVRVLRRMKDAGYTTGDIPDDGTALLNLILARKAISEFRWTNVEEIVAKGGALAFIDEAAYRADFDVLPETVRAEIDRAWGPFPAKSMVYQPAGEPPCLIISGLRFGNILVLTDPKRGCYGARCDGEVCRILHEPQIPPPHHWLATYWFLQREADVLIHMGAESALEYLPGKRVALGEQCFSTLSLGDLPSIYPFVVNSPGEGLIAKRRGRAVMIDHLSAPVARADRMGPRWDQLEDLHRQFLAADGSRLGGLTEMLRAELVSMGLLDEAADEAALALALDQLPRRIQRLRARTLMVGRHVLGAVPGEDWSDLYVAEVGRDEDSVRAGLAVVGAEQDAVIAALSGRFIPPGPGGHLSRGRADILPTGRNFYGIDLALIPTEAACAVGAAMGAKLLDAYLADEGVLPATIAITLWSSDAFQADGELTAQALWLMGCRPRREGNGKVTGIEAIPLEEMILATGEISRRRPRMDVVVQMSGVVRDTLPGLYGLLDAAAALVADLDEGPDDNLLRAHVLEREAALADSLADLPAAGLRRLVRCRVFSAAEGSYGSGISLAMDASAWKDDADLAEVLVNWSGHAFGADGRAASGADVGLAEYAHLLRTTDISYQRQAAPERDLLSLSSYLDIQGGAAAAKRGLGGGGMRLYWGDSHCADGGEVRSLKEELSQSLAASLLNPDWLAMTKERGYAGARDVAERANRLYGWSATTHQVEKAQFDAVHDRYIRDRDNCDWLRSSNLYALEELTRRLLEAQARGLWDADAERLGELHAAVLDLEGDMEDRMGESGGTFQGGSVDIITRDQVKEWSYAFRAS
jgi:cobaltochelatase CobN